MNNYRERVMVNTGPVIRQKVDVMKGKEPPLIPRERGILETVLGILTVRMAKVKGGMMEHE